MSDDDRYRRCPVILSREGIRARCPLTEGHHGGHLFPGKTTPRPEEPGR